MLNTLKIQISFREVNVKHSLALFHRLPYIGITKDNISKTNNFELNQNHTRRSSRLEFDRQMV